MCNKNITYLPKLQDWVDYYGKGCGQLTADTQSDTTGLHNDKTQCEGTPIHTGVDVQNTSTGTSTSTSTGEGTMGKDIQVISPVQTAVNQAMATKKRRRPSVKKKTRRRKSATRKKPTKVRGKRRKITNKKKRKKKKKSKTQRDIFNF